LIGCCRNQKTITAEPGQDVTLTCRAPNKHIIVVKWSRADLGDEYVLLYRDGHFVPDDQHPSFKNRVDLQDRQMKDGDVSLILKDVTINDTGTYECRVVQRVGPMTLIISTNLSVVVPPAASWLLISWSDGCSLLHRMNRLNAGRVISAFNLFKLVIKTLNNV
uniref:Ig-like domain-containing protein n=1 Tax=Pundamilia nyererei TaxID=303518 RepID=A0A3B4HAY6_9CICH